MTPDAVGALTGDEVGVGLRDRGRLRRGAVELLIFRAGGELFGVELCEVEEAMDVPELHGLPEMPFAMRGVFTLRGTTVSVFDAAGILGVRERPPGAVLVFAQQDHRVALAIDDVDDVMTLDLRTLRESPGAELNDGLLLGVARRGPDLIGILDADAVVAVCRTERAAGTP